MSGVEANAMSKDDEKRSKTRTQIRDADECARVGCQRTGVEPIQLARKASIQTIRPTLPTFVTIESAR